MVVEVMPVGVEDAVPPQPQRLVDLEIEADRGHGGRASYRMVSNFHPQAVGRRVRPTAPRRLILVLTNLAARPSLYLLASRTATSGRRTRNYPMQRRCIVAVLVVAVAVAGCHASTGE